MPFRLSNLWYFVFHVFEEIRCEKGGADEMVLMKGWPSWAKQRKNGSSWCGESRDPLIRGPHTDLRFQKWVHQPTYIQQNLPQNIQQGHIVSCMLPKGPNQKKTANNTLLHAQKGCKKCHFRAKQDLDKPDEKSQTSQFLGKSMP